MGFEEGCCSCHINPPCSYCTSHAICEECGEMVLEGYINDDLICDCCEEGNPRTMVGTELETEQNKLPSECTNCSKVNFVSTSLEACHEWKCWHCGGYVSNVVGEKKAREARKKWAAAEVKPDWMDDQCAVVFNSIAHLSLVDKIMVIDQVLDYLRQEEACKSAALKE